MRLRGVVFLAVGLAAAAVGVAGEPGGTAAQRCPPEKIPPSAVVTHVLGVAPRAQDARRPPEGWCGETAIQEALLYHGIYAPQAAINAAGRPVHPDLYANELPTALAAFGAACDAWPSGAPRADLAAFTTWIRQKIESGAPVLCGVKINPSTHPEWAADHFALAVGTENDTILFNPAGWGEGRVARTLTQLGSTAEKGFAFESPWHSFFALAVRDRADRPKGSGVVRLFVESETSTSLHVVVKCEELRVGSSYTLLRGAPGSDRRGARTVGQFVAESSVEAFRDEIAADAAVAYWCRRD